MAGGKGRAGVMSSLGEDLTLTLTPNPNPDPNPHHNPNPNPSPGLGRYVGRRSNRDKCSEG